MKKFIDNLKRQAEENPIVAIIVVTAAIKAGAHMMEASTVRTKARTHEREIDRRIMMAQYK